MYTFNISFCIFNNTTDLIKHHTILIKTHHAHDWQQQLNMRFAITVRNHERIKNEDFIRTIKIKKED